MDDSKRYITKIAREASKFTLLNLREEGVGSGEVDLIHLVRHHPGITQAQVRKELKMDKGAAARRTASLEAKGYLVRKENPEDARSQCLYATEQADQLRNSKASCETLFYEWLLEGLSEEERAQFCVLLEKLYQRSKKESRGGFVHVAERMNHEAGHE